MSDDTINVEMIEETYDKAVLALLFCFVLFACLCVVASQATVSVEIVRDAKNKREREREKKPYSTYRRFLAHQIEMYLDANTDFALTRFLAVLLRALDRLEEERRHPLPADVVSIVIHRLFKAAESPTPTYPREVWLSLSGVLQALAAIETSPENMQHTLRSLHDRYEAVRDVWRSPVVLASMRSLLPDCVPAEWDVRVPPLELRRFYKQKYDLLLCEEDANLVCDEGEDEGQDDEGEGQDDEEKE